MKARAAILLLVPALILSAGGHRKRHSGPLVSERDAKAIAARETGGTVVSAHEIPLNAASGGWEVDVHMPNEERGWRCVIDDDTRMVRTKERIPNPVAPAHSRKRK